MLFICMHFSDSSLRSEHFHLLECHCQQLLPDFFICILYLSHLVIVFGFHFTSFKGLCFDCVDQVLQSAVGSVGLYRCAHLSHLVIVCGFHFTSV